MTLDQWLSLGLLALALVLFAWGRLRHDVVALIVLIGVAVTGLVPPDQLVSGFGHPAVITVAAVLVVSRAMKSAGVIDVLARYIEPFTKTAFLQMTVLTGVCAVASAFMNNVGALAVLLPVALASAEERGRPPALLLMPLAFGSILGGMMTLIGTPPNIIISTIRAQTLGEPYGMFDFSYVGVPVAVAGLLFIALIGWRLIPKERKGGISPDQLFQISDYIVEARVREKSKLIGKRMAHVAQITGEAVVITGKVNADGQIETPEPWRPLAHNDILILKADPKDLEPLIDELGVEVVTDRSKKEDEESGEEKDRGKDLRFTEAMVTPDSPLLGRGAATLELRSGYQLALMAIARMGEQIRRRLHNVRFQPGDVLLLQQRGEDQSELIADLGLLPLPERGLNLGQQRKALLAVAIFAGAIALSMFGILPIAVAFIAAIVCFLATDILKLRELYSHIDWPVIVLLGGMIPLGTALEISGTTTLLAGSLLGLTSALPVWALLALVMIVTMFLSDIINNAATALIMAPLAIAIAAGLDVNPDPFLMSVAIGASCAFLTPIGHQSNTLVMAPGGYRFSDYWRMGLPLEALIVLIAVPLLMVAWPL